MRTLQDFQRQYRNTEGSGLIVPPSPVASVKDIDTLQGIVTMYWAAFGNVDAYRDVIRQGAFKKSIAEWGPNGRKRIAHLLNHDSRHRIGVPVELTEDSHGLLARSKLLGQNHSKARDALIEYEEGCITEHSIGFRLIKYEIDDEEDIWYLNEIQLYEGSGVTWGANMETPTVDVKSLREDPLLFDDLVRQVRSIERALKREVTDDFALELEDRLKTFKRITSELDTALRDEFAIEPSGAETSDTQDDEKSEPHVSAEIQRAKAMVRILQTVN